MSHWFEDTFGLPSTCNNKAGAEGLNLNLFFTVGGGNGLLKYLHETDLPKTRRKISREYGGLWYKLTKIFTLGT